MKSTKIPSGFKKLGMFTDIHFGRRSNSKIHNQDCVDFVEWFCQQIEAAGDYSHVCFLGDWFESRSAINIETMEYSYSALRRLNGLGIPVYFVVGNHDLHRRTTRELHSVRIFQEMSNFTVIDKIHVEDGMLFSPYLFEAEYEKLIQYNDLWAWAGHFEFKNFIITGYNTVMEHGPDHKLFSGPKKIFSGHFHKRQGQDNVQYIGNAFPMDFGDAGDVNRGLCTYLVQEDKMEFTDWPECPSYYRTTLSDVMAERWTPLPKMKVKCIVDVDVSYQEAQELREAMIEAYQLRDFVLEEDREKKQGVLEGENVKVTESMLNFTGIDDLVTQQLEVLKTDPNVKVDPDLLISIYKDLPVEAVEGNE